MTVYYTHTNSVPSNQSRGTSSSIRAEFDAIAAGFALASNDIAAIAAASGTALASSAEVTLPSAAGGVTIIGSTAGNIVSITGTNNITSFGPTYTNPKFIRFTGSLTLINSASLVLPGGANITTQPGDCCIATPIGNPATGWRVEDYTRMSQPMLNDDALRKSVTVTLAQGGTGATTAGGALANLGAAASGANNDITALSALTSAGSSAGMNLPYVISINGGQLAGLRNRIINGDMRVSQRGTAFPAIALGTYFVDRFAYNGNATSAVVTAGQGTSVPSSNEFQYNAYAQVTTADTSIAATDNVILAQSIEGYNVRDLIGNAFTLSFWVESSKTGTHCVSFRNSGSDRSYVVEYTINAANTWEKKSVTVPAGLITGGTWNWTNGVGLSVSWSLASGSNFQTTAGAWQTGNYFATANQVNCLDTIGNVFAITGVQLERGSVATPFEQRPYGLELALCQRYYQGYQGQQIMGCHPASTYSRINYFLPVSMRANPTLNYKDSAGNVSKYTSYATNDVVTNNLTLISAAAVSKQIVQLLIPNTDTGVNASVDYECVAEL